MSVRPEGPAGHRVDLRADADLGAGACTRPCFSSTCAVFANDRHTPVSVPTESAYVELKEWTSVSPCLGGSGLAARLGAAAKVEIESIV